MARRSGALSGAMRREGAPGGIVCVEGALVGTVCEEGACAVREGIRGGRGIMVAMPLSLGRKIFLYIKLKEKNGERLTCWSHGIEVGLNTTVSNGGKYPIQPRNRPIPSTKQQTGMVCP